MEIRARIVEKVSQKDSRPKIAVRIFEPSPLHIARMVQFEALGLFADD